eukprot:12895909-Prorocentrum_lima.AAC.1
MHHCSGLNPSEPWTYSSFLNQVALVNLPTQYLLHVVWSLQKLWRHLDQVKTVVLFRFSYNGCKRS